MIMRLTAIYTIFIITCLILLLLLPSTSNAGYCKVISSPECIEIGTKKIEGFTVTKDCWKYKSKYECYNDNYIDYCKSISSIPGCTETGNICKEKSPTGECNNSEKTYRCGSKIGDAKDTVYLDSNYTITKDEKDLKECSPHIISRDCEMAEEKCIEGRETREINGHPVTKDCWKWDRKYACITGSKVSDCQDYEKKCALKGEICMSEEGKEQDLKGCHHKEKTYECVEVTGEIPASNECKKLGYCIGGDCENVTYEKNKNMTKAASYLNLLNNMGKELKKSLCDDKNLDKCEVFKGEDNRCKKMIWGFRNCCKESKGKGSWWGLNKCSESEQMLAEKKKAGLCHRIGTYCSERWKFPRICVAKKTSYCCFGSKLSRILQEEIREQQGAGWGEPKNPDCRNLTIEELQKADWSKIDLKEFFGDVMKNFNPGASKEFSNKDAPDSVKGKVQQAMNNPDYNFHSKYGTNINNGSDKYEAGKRYKESVEKSIKRPYRQKVEESEKVDLGGRDAR